MIELNLPVLPKDSYTPNSVVSIYSLLRHICGEHEMTTVLLLNSYARNL
jgi:hypothetical protein